MVPRTYKLIYVTKTVDFCPSSHDPAMCIFLFGRKIGFNFLQGDLTIASLFYYSLAANTSAQRNLFASYLLQNPSTYLQIENKLIYLNNVSLEDIPAHLRDPTLVRIQVEFNLFRILTLYLF
jgi:hypothetical protein